MKCSTLLLLLSHTIGSILYVHSAEFGCDFPDGWRQGIKWLTSLDMINGKAVPNLVTFGENTAFTSTATDPDQKIDTHFCKDYEAPSSTYSYNYYKRDTSLNGAYHICVQEFKRAGLIFHLEKTDGRSLRPACKDEFGDASMYTLYVPVTVNNPGPDFTWHVDVNSNLPTTFKRAYYKVTYSLDENNRDRCAGETSSSSVASVDRDIIGITTCESTLSGYHTPYSGRMKAMAEFSPMLLGEPDDTKGRILILSYLSPDIVGFYCARYKADDTTITLSLDITSQADLRCQKDARYDWFGDHNGRQYLQFNFTFFIAFSTVIPPSGAVTQPPPDSSAYVQFALKANYTKVVTDKNSFGEALKDDIGRLAVVSEGRVNIIDIEKGPEDNTYVTAQITPSGGDGKTVDAAMDVFRATTQQPNSVNYMNGPTNHAYELKNDYFHKWRDTDSQCRNLQCASDKGRCWVITGTFYCKCSGDNTGDKCDGPQPTGSPGGDGLDEMTITIIIAVCVAFGVILILAVILVICCRHCRKRKGHTEQMQGYDNYYTDTTQEERDKEMYSTIGKKPKAYHDKQFVKDDNPSSVATTGIHL